MSLSMLCAERIMNFGKTLKLYRTKAGLTQERVADYLGISTRSYQRYEADKMEPNVKFLIMLADLYRVTLDELVDRFNQSLGDDAAEL